MKNPKRVAAGRKNRALRKPLSEASRARMREAAHRNKPWQYSTGPRTPEGKKVVSRNAVKSWTANESISQPSPLLEDAIQLLHGLRDLRSSCVLNVESAQVESGDALAKQVREAIFGADRDVVKDLAAELQHSGRQATS